MTTKKQLTAEQRAMLNELVNGAFSSIAIHFIGDNLSKGWHCTGVCDPSSQAGMDWVHRPLRQEDGRNACLPLRLLTAQPWHRN